MEWNGGGRKQWEIKLQSYSNFVISVVQYIQKAYLKKERGGGQDS